MLQFSRFTSSGSVGMCNVSCTGGMLWAGHVLPHPSLSPPAEISGVFLSFFFFVKHPIDLVMP